MQEVRIAVCDDEPGDRQSLCQQVERYCAGKQIALEEFADADGLLAAARKAPFSLVLLDIEMDGVSGFEAAKQLAKQTPRPLVLFVTKSDAYTLRGYGLVFRYLVKPIDPALFAQAMDAAFDELCAHRLSFDTEAGTVSLLLEQILYLESFGHTAVIHTQNGEYRLRATLADLLGRLPKSRFASPHKSYLVNLEHVQQATAAQVLLTDQTRIPVSRRRRQEFSQAYFQYLGR